MGELTNGEEGGDEGAEEGGGADGPFDHGAQVLMHAVEALVKIVEAGIELASHVIEAGVDLASHAVEALIDFPAELAEVGFQFSDIVFEDLEAGEDFTAAIEGFFFEEEHQFVEAILT